jgi:hypothetical protein
MSEHEFTQALGFRTVGMQDGAFVIELELERRHMSRAERVHGGQAPRARDRNLLPDRDAAAAGSGAGMRRTMVKENR